MHRLGLVQQFPRSYTWQDYFHFQDDLIQETEQMIYEFLWNMEKRIKLKKDVTIQDFKGGGHKMVNIRSLIMT